MPRPPITMTARLVMVHQASLPGPGDPSVFCQRETAVLTLFHAFNMTFQEILSHLDMLSSLGFDGLQISPAQSSMKNDRVWYHRYQPRNYSRLEGLGTEQDLNELCAQAKRHGLFVVADLVFNHMGPICSEKEAREAFAASRKGQHHLVKKIEARLDAFVPFTRDDFHPFRPIGGFDYDDDSLRFTGWGGEGTWPDLKPTDRVLGAQRAHIDLLHACGVRGFRFDAVKQMFPDEQYAPLVEHCRALPGVRLIYGEVLSIPAEAHERYIQHAWTTDFQLMHSLVKAFETEKDLGSLADPEHLDARAILFSRNHDTVLQHLPGLSFTDMTSAALAGAFALAFVPPRHKEHGVLVFADDVLCDPAAAVTQCAMHLRRAQKLRAQSGKHVTSAALQPKRPDGSAHKELLWIQCGESGGILLNASADPAPLANLVNPAWRATLLQAEAAPLGSTRPSFQVTTSTYPNRAQRVTCPPGAHVLQCLDDWECPGGGVLVVWADESTCGAAT